MKIFDLYKKSFLSAITNPTISMFLVLFLILSNLMANQMITSKTAVVSMILSFCIFTLTLAFISGWLYVAKEISIEGEKENKNYFAIFLEGIGKNIVSVGIASFIYTLLFTIILFIAGKIAYLAFGSLDFILKDITSLTQDTNQFIEYLEKLTIDQQYTLYCWQMCFIAFLSIFNFILLFYFPAVIFSEKNIFIKPFRAFIDSIKFTFKNFFGSLLIYLTIFFAYFALSVLRFLFAQNALILILLLFLYIYFICGAVMLIFSYYGQKNNCNNGCYSIGENEIIDKTSEEN
ncbi:hypothetical protein IJX73_05935 [bacterium]|nr:hypothetical protein [bacterium]